LLAVAGDFGFWRLSPSFLEQVAGYLRLALPAAPSRMTLFVRLVMKVCNCLAPLAAQKLRHRLAEGEQSSRFCLELAQMDEVDEVLDRYDHQAFKDEVKAATARRDEEKVFRDEFRKHMRAMRAEMHKGKKPKAPGAKKAPPDFRGMDQKAARKLVPPTTHIWKDNVDSAWECHVQPFARKSFSFHKFGSEESSLQECLRHMWRQYSLLEGVDHTTECPIFGLFPAVADVDGSDLD
jgi:hypothetical protein